MSILRFWVKTLLFISAYTPLFLILLIRYIIFLSIWFVILLTILICLNLILILIFKIAKKFDKNEIKVKTASNETSNAMNYVIAYIIAFIGFRFEYWQDWVIFLILIFIIYFVYINSNLIFINPILQILGYKIFNVTTITEEKIILLCRKNKIKNNSVINIKNLTEDIYIEVG